MATISPAVNGGGNLNMTYDAQGRREILAQSSSYGSDDMTFLYDGGTAIAATDNLYYNHQTLNGPGGEVLSYLDKGPSAPGSWVPLHDLAGSTIAMVNSSGAIDQQYTYDPSGNYSYSGSYRNTNPYLYQGMEYVRNFAARHLAP